MLHPVVQVVIRLHNAPWWSSGKDLVLSVLWTGFISQSGKPFFLGFPDGSEGKECGRHGFDPWVGKIPWRRV